MGYFVSLLCFYGGGDGTGRYDGIVEKSRGDERGFGWRDDDILCQTW